MIVPNNSDTYLQGVVFIPSSLNIIAITQAMFAVVTITVNTVTESNTYHIGQLVRFTVLKPYGMSQINGLTASIISVNGNNLTIDLDTTMFDPFSIPSSNIGTPASLAPAGSRNLQFDNTTNSVPFQPLNNVGN